MRHMREVISAVKELTERRNQFVHSPWATVDDDDSGHMVRLIVPRDARHGIEFEDVPPEVVDALADRAREVGDIIGDFINLLQADYPVFKERTSRPPD